MSLIASARALDDPRFRWRVSAAAIYQAGVKVTDPDSVDQRYAEHVLDHPDRLDPTLIALVATRPSISDLVTVDEFNTVSTEAVTDNQILTAVGTMWARAATRYDERSATAVQS